MDLTQNNNVSGMSGRAKSFFKWVLVIGLVIVTNLFFYFAIDAFYKEPKYDNFCKQEQIVPLVKTQNECVNKGGQWTETPAEKNIIIYQGTENRPVAVNAPEKETGGYCNLYFTCQKEYDEALSVYNRNIFIILVILGVALIVGSYFVALYGAVSLGFALAGILSLIIGATRYWAQMDERLRVVVLGVALVTLIWYGIKKFRE